MYSNKYIYVQTTQRGQCDRRKKNKYIYTVLREIEQTESEKWV